jgi:cation-dependent mannose-6-phosphate receptor
MNYTDGSPCDGEFIEKSSHKKSTMLSFLCDRDITATTPLISFVGTMDQCTYFFEVRSAAACGGYSNDSAGQGLSPGGIFGVM